MLSRRCVLFVIMECLLLLICFSTAWAGVSSPAASIRLSNPEKVMLQKSKAGTAVTKKIDARLLKFADRLSREAVARAKARNFTKAPGVSLGLGDLSVDHVARVSNTGELQVYVQLESNNAGYLDQLRQRGLRIELNVGANALVQGWIAYDKLDQLSSLPFVKSVRLPSYAFTRTGQVTSQGDGLLQASAVRALPLPGPYDGTGVKVGVISDGADSRMSDVASHDLPVSGVTVHPTIYGSGDEGTAMLEIVHDLAPGASLYFGGPSTSAEMVQLINWMANTVNCDVIVDDLGFFAEPYFEDGPIAQAARKAVITSGRVYCSAAGNDADTHYQGLFSDPQSGIQMNNQYLNDFDPGPGVDQYLNYKVYPGETAIIALQWNDKWGTSSNDYDLYLFNPQTNAVLAKSDASQNGSDDPLEIATYTNKSRSIVDIGVGVVLSSGAPKTIEIYTMHVVASDSHLTPADSIYGQTAVPEVISCATINANTFSNGSIAYYSSRGPATITFPANETRQVPFITGVDGVSVTGAGGFYNPFYGTSASAPHLAGICALLRQKNPDATPAMIRDALAATAIDKGTSGYDYTYGYGVCDALAAVQQLAPKAVVAPVLVVTPENAFSTSGSAGGVFTPSTMKYTLTNSGGGALAWNVAKSQAWVQVSPSSGSLNAGESTQVTVSVENTNTMTPGTYTDTLQFVNTSNHQGDAARAITATVKLRSSVMEWIRYQ